jgi:hypothetical protein
MLATLRALDIRSICPVSLEGLGSARRADQPRRAFFLAANTRIVWGPSMSDGASGRTERRVMQNKRGGLSELSFFHPARYAFESCCRRSAYPRHVHWVADGKFNACRSNVRNARIAVMGIDDGERLQLEVQNKR